MNFNFEFSMLELNGYDVIGIEWLGCHSDGLSLNSE